MNLVSRSTDQEADFAARLAEIADEVASHWSSTRSFGLATTSSGPDEQVGGRS